MTLIIVSALTGGWVDVALDALAAEGCTIVTDAVDDATIRRLRSGLYLAREGILRDIGPARLERAGELGTLRAPMLYDDAFFDILANRHILEIVDRTVGETAILHLINGFALPSLDPNATPTIFQNSFHRDFPRYLNGYVGSINAFVTVDAFTRENGATLVVPGSHQLAAAPSEAEMRAKAIAVEAPAGSVLLFDSTLWHAAGRNVSGEDRLALNLQFTRSYIKQQIDYVRALGDEVILRQPDRTQQLLGWYTRVVTSLEEYYRDPGQRLYRAGQG